MLLDFDDLQFSPNETGLYNVQPLGITDLVSFRQLRDMPVTVVLEDVNVSRLPAGWSGDVCPRVEYPYSVPGDAKIYGMVPGGWLPPGLPARHLAFFDRNMINGLRGAGKSGIVEKDHRNWIYRNVAYGANIVSPVLALLEGGLGSKVPSEESLRAEANEMHLWLPDVFPAQFQPLNDEQLSRLFCLIEEVASDIESTQKFFVEAAPFLQPSDSNRQGRICTVAEIAKKQGVRTNSFPFIAALSCVAARGSRSTESPGILVVKPQDIKSGYNGVADLSSLEYLLQAVDMFDDVEPVMFTEDFGLAFFWTSLNVGKTSGRTTVSGKRKTSVCINPSFPAMFPALKSNEEIRQVLDLIKG